MATSIENVKGIGPATAALLAAAGIVTAEELATASMPKLTMVQGFSKLRAERVLAAAREALAQPAEAATSVGKTDTKKTDTKKTDTKKTDTKKTDKKKTDKKKTDKKKTDKKK